MTPQHQLMPSSPAYAWMMSAGILIGALFWHRRAKGNPDLLIIYIGALCGAFMGAKLAYLIAEGWLDEGRRIAVATVVETWGSAPRRRAALPQSRSSPSRCTRPSRW